MGPMEVFSDLNEEIHLVQGELEQQAQKRLIEAIKKLLKFKNNKDAIRKWLESRCDCGSCNRSPFEPRWQLILNEYGYRHLLQVIESAQHKRIVFRSGDRVVRVETGEKGTVNRQFIDGYVSLIFDDGCPALLDRSSLKKIEPSRHKVQK